MTIRRSPFSVRARAGLLATVVCLLAVIGVVSYRIYARPTVLTIAMGSSEAEAKHAVALIAGRLATTNASIESEIDDILETSVQEGVDSTEESRDLSGLILAAGRLQSLIHDRRHRLEIIPARHALRRDTISGHGSGATRP